MITLTAGTLDESILQDCLRGDFKINLDQAAYQNIDAANQQIDKIIQTGDAVYSINTGFGQLANQRIASKDLSTLQHNLILSHATGVGAPLCNDIVRLILLLKINSLSLGYSGVRREIVDYLIALLNHELYPVVPSQGSVGASGDLAPLAHLVLPLIGEGHVTLKNGEKITGLDALKKCGLAPLTLAPKEGLALINGTQVSTAIALAAAFRLKKLLNHAIQVGALSVEAARGSHTPFHPAIHAARNQPAQIEIAAIFRDLLENSEIAKSHADCGRVQDPYCLRCQPQVMGACLEQLNHALAVLIRESNAVTDNPVIVAKDNLVLSGGNFHAEPVAFAADNLALPIAELGNLTERQIALLIDHTMSDGLPAFLVEKPGLNSGFMILHVTAAALASENKQQSHPASVDTIPTSAGQEDHVSMATHAAMRLHRMLDNLEEILSIGYFAACQAVDLRKPVAVAKPLQPIYETIRDRAEYVAADRQFSDDLQNIKRYIKETL